MEDDDNIISTNDNGITNISSKRKHSDLFWYDILNLPDLLLIEILARLPLKSIFRVKLVCKHWQTLISHPSFFRFYSSTLNCNARFRILYRYIYVSNYYDFPNRLQPEFLNPSKFSVLFLSTVEEREQNTSFKVLSISNGLILFSLLWSSPFVYCICDPITRQCLTLPKRRGRKYEFYGEGLITRVNEDHMLTSFTVVMVEIHDYPLNYLYLDMFSSEIGEWVYFKLPCASPIRLLKRGGGPVHCYGAFHWLTHNHGIVAFDPHKDPKHARFISLPNDGDVFERELNDEVIYRLCDGCQGTLRYLEVAHDSTKMYFLTMWSMKDYEKGNWCCEFKVRRSDLLTSDLGLSNWLLKGRFLPLSFHPLNMNVVYLKCIELGWIVSYDVVNRRLDFACKLNGGFEDLSWRVVVPFMLPRWPLLLSDCTKIVRLGYTEWVRRGHHRRHA